MFLDFEEFSRFLQMADVTHSADTLERLFAAFLVDDSIFSSEPSGPKMTSKANPHRRHLSTLVESETELGT